MARKSRTSKKTEENNADETEVSKGSKTGAPGADTLETESDVTSNASDPDDTTSGDAASEPDSETEAEQSGDGSNIEAVETTPADAVEADIDTVVAGVVAAQAAPSERAAPPSAPAVTHEVRSGPSTFALVFGGLLAGAAGFLVATFAVPDGWPNPTPTEQGVTSEDLAMLSSQVEALAAEVEGISVAAPDPTVPVDLGPLESGLEALQSAISGSEDRLTSLSETVEALGTRLQTLEEQPAPSEPDGSAAMEAQLEAFRTELDAVTDAARASIEEAQARADQIEAEAAESAAAAARQAAISEIAAALESGAAFAGSTARLDNVPEALASVAETGVRTLSSLQDEFPDKARDALRTAQTVQEDASTGDRMVAFLRRQTNARSLAPRDGDDVDAILSRAEAALTGGDLSAAIAEVQNLPEDALAAMGTWIDDALARQAAVSSLGELN